MEQSYLLISLRSLWILLLMAVSSLFSLISTLDNSLRSHLFYSPKALLMLQLSFSVQFSLLLAFLKIVSSWGMQEKELAFSAFLFEISNLSLLQLGVFIYLLDRQQEGLSPCLFTSQSRLLDVDAQSNLFFAAARGEQQWLALTQFAEGSFFYISGCLSTWFHSLVSASYIRLISFSLAFSSYSLPWYISSQSLSLDSSILYAYLYFNNSYLIRLLAFLLYSTTFIYISLSRESVTSITLRSTSMSIPAIFCLRSNTHYCNSSTYLIQSPCTFSSSPKVCSLSSLAGCYSPQKNTGKCYSSFALQLTVSCSLLERS